jgi:uncharacterized membrane protein
MTGNEANTNGNAGLRTTRTEAFSDGVFAIAITLLVLEIGIPAASEGDLLKALVDQWPSYLAYLVSFSTIGAIWLKHTVITDYLDRATAGLIRLNLLLLLVVSFLPFPTRLVGEHIRADEAERVAVTAYGINLLLASLVIGAMWRYAVREHLVRRDATDEDVAMVGKQLVPSLAFYAVMIALGLFAPVLAVLGYLVIALYIIVPLHALRHRKSRA